MGAHTPASAPHCRQFSEGGPSPTSLPNLRVGHGCSHPSLDPALQTVQWRRTLPHLPAYLAGGPWVLTPKPRTRTAGSSVKADPPPPPCLPCGWAMGAHTPASAPHCRQFSECGPSLTSLPTLRVGHGCSHPGLGPALQTVQWRRTLPHLPAYLAGGPWVLTPQPRPRTADSSVKADPPPPPCLPCGWAMGAHTPASAPHCRQFSEGGPSPTSLPTLRVGHGCSQPGLGPALQTVQWSGPSPTSLPTLRVGHGCSHPGLSPALQTVQWRRTLPHLPAYLAGGPWVLTPRPRPRTSDSSVKAHPPPPPCLPCGWAMGAHTPALGPALQTVQWRRTLPHLPAYLAGGPWVLTPRPRPSLQTDQWRRTLPHLPAYLAGGPWVLTPRPPPRTADSSVKADPPPPPCLPCGWAMGAHTPASTPHCRQFSEGGPSPTSLPTLRVGHGCSHPGLGPALQTVQWRRTLPHLPAYLAGGPWVLTPRPLPRTADSSVKADPPLPPCLPCGWAMGAHTPASARTADSSVKADPPPPPCLPCGWAMGAHIPASAPHCRQFSEGGPSPTSLPTLRVGHGCSHPGLGPALQTVQWRRTLPHLPAYLAGGPWVLTPRPRPCTADSSVKADPPPPPCLPCGWAMGAHTPASAPHCRQFSEGAPSPTSLPTLRVGHGCSHPGLGPALQTVQWRRTLPHLPAYLAGGPLVLTPRPRPLTADSSVKADPPPPTCLPCGWAMGAHTPASAPHCRQFSESGPSPTSLPTLRVGHGCSHPGHGPALQTVQWRRTLPHLPAYLAGGPWVLTPRPRPRTADGSVKTDPPQPPCLPCRWAMGAHTQASAPHCRQFSEGGPSPTSLPTLRVGHGCSHPGLGPALQTVQWRRTLPHLPAYLAGGPWVLTPRPRPRTADSSVKADPPPPPLRPWVLTPRPRPRTADSSVKADPPPPPCLPCGWAMGAHTPAWAPHCRQFSEGGPSPTSLPTLRVGHGCSHPGLGPALQTVQWRRTLPHLPAYLAGGPWVLTTRLGPRTGDISSKADPPPPPCLPCGWAMGAHTPASAPHCRQFSEGGPSPTSLPTLRVGHGCSHPASAPHCRQFSAGGPSPTSLPTLRVGHGCSHPGLGPALQTVQWRRTLPHLPAYLAGGPWVLTPRPRPRTADSSVKADPPPPPCLPCGWAMGAHTPSLGPALQTVQWRRTLPHLPAYLAGGPWVLTPRPRPRTADSSVKADPPPPPCLPCGWAMGAHTVQWRRTLPHLPAYLADGPWVLTPWPRPRTADSSVKADPPPPPCLPCGWAMGAHTPASAPPTARTLPHLPAYLAGGPWVLTPRPRPRTADSSVKADLPPSPTRVGHGCSHPLPTPGPALQTVQWRRTLPHLPAYLAGGPWVLTPRPRPRTADSSVKADPPPPPCLPCGWAMGAHTPASAPHCRQFSEGGPSPTSLPTLRVGHGCSHPGQWRRTLPHLPGGWAMGAHTQAWAPHCRQFSEGGPSPTSLPTLRVGHGCSHPGLGPALQTVQWRRTLPHLPAYLAGGPWVLTPRPRPRTADSSVKADPPPPPCLPCGWAMGAHTPASAPHCRQFSEGGPSPTSLPTLRVGHGCSHPGLGPALQTVQWRRTLPHLPAYLAGGPWVLTPGLGPALQTVQWRRTLPHLPAYLAGGPWVLTPRPRPRTADSSVKADPPPPPCLPCGWAMGAHTPASAPHCRQFSEGGPSPTSLPTLRVGHGCSHPGLGPALQTVQWRRTLPHLPAYLAGGPWVLTPRPRPRTADSSVKADPPPPPCLPCGWAMGAHTPASAPHCRQFSEGGPSPTSLPTLRVGHGCSHPGLGPALQTVQWRRTLPHLPAYLAGGPWVLTPRPRPRTADSSVKADPPPPPCLPCGWAMGAHTPASAPHCRQFSEGGPSPTSLPTLRVGHGCSHPGLSPHCRQFSEGGPSPTSLPTLRVGHGCSHPGLGPALQTVQWRRTLPHLPAYLAGGPWVLTPRPRPRTADSSVKADPPPPPCLPCGWAMGAHTPASAPHCRQFSEGGPSPTSLPTLRVGHGCSHPGLGPALQTVQWRRTLPHLPAYLAGGPWVLTPRPRPRTADSSVKADPPPPPCLPCGWAMGAHTPASAPHCRQFSEGGPSPTSLPTLRVGHGCSHPGLGPALQTVQWRRTLPHLPAYLAGGPPHPSHPHCRQFSEGGPSPTSLPTLRVGHGCSPRPGPRTADSSVKADPPPPPCLPCGWAMGAHTPASAPHCRQFSEGGPSPTSLPTLRVGHGCSHPGLGPALQTVQWRRRLPCGWAMGAHTPASAPHCRQFSEGGPSPTSLPTLRVGHGCSHPGLGPALQTVQWRRTLPHLPAYLAGGPWVLTPRPRPRTADSSVKADPPPPPCLPCGWAMGAHTPASAPHCRQFSEGGPSLTSLPTLRVGHGCSHPGLGPALQTVQWRRTLPHLPAYLAGGPWVLTPRPRPRTADSSVKADPPPPPCLPCGWAMGAHTPASAPHCRQFSEGGPSPTSLPTLRVGHGCSHPGLGPALQTVQWRRTLPHLPAYLAGGPWVLTPKPRPRTADSSVKADPPPPPCLPCGWAMGAHTPASAPHCRQFSEGGPSPTSLPTLRVGHGCSHPGLGPALQTVQWRRTLPHLPAYLAGGPWVLTPKPGPRTADSSVKADPPPPPCLPCGWAMGAHTPASAPHCRQFSEGGPSPTSLPTLRVGHGCSHPGLGPALQTVQWRRTLPHLPAYLAGGPWVLTPRPRPRTADSSVKADPPPPPCLPCGWAMGAHTPASAPHCRQFSEGGPSPTSLPTLRVGHGCSHPGLGPALQTVQWRRTLPHLPAYLAGGPWVLTPRPRPRTADSSVKADPPPPPCLTCGWAMGAHTQASAPTAAQTVQWRRTLPHLPAYLAGEGGPSPTSLPTLRVGAHTPASAPHCRQFSEGGPSPTSLPTLRVGHGCSHPGLGPALQTVQWRRTLPHLPAYLAGGPWVLTPRPQPAWAYCSSHPGLGPALQTVQWRRTLPHLPAYLAGGPWVLTPRPRPRTADSSVKADPPPPPCLPCGWAMGAHTPASAPHCRQFSEGGPSPTSLPTLRVGHGCSHPGLGPALQTVQWRRTLPHLPAYLAGGPWVLTPRPRPRTADSSVKADPPPPPCLPCGWAMGAHTPAWAPHCRQFSEGGPSPTSLPTLRVGHGCSHPGLGPALQTVQWRRTLPHLPAYLAGGPWVLTPRPRPRTADSSVKADPPPPPCLPCGWAMGAHTPASAPHCRQFSEGGPSPTSLPTLRVGHGCSHPGLGPALQTVQWRRTLPHLPAYLAGGPWVLTPRPRPRTADSSVKADPPPPPCLPCGWALPGPRTACGWAMGAHTPASAPHCRQFSEGGPSPTSLPTLRVMGAHTPASALQTVQWRRTLPHLPAYLAGGPWVLTPRPRPRTADSSVKADPPPPPCLPCGWAMGAHTPASAPHCRQFSEGGPSPTSLPTLRVGHGCSHPGLGPALQTVQWRRTLPHLPAYLAGGPWVLTPRPRPRTADSSVKADPPPPPCLPCGWAMGAHTPASAPHCRQFSEGGPSPTSLPTLRVGHGCSHPGLGPALQTVQWRRTLPHLPAYLAGGPWVLTPRPQPGPALQSGLSHPDQFSEGGPSPTSLPTLRVGHGCSHPGLGPALQTVQWRRTLPHLPAYLAGGPWVLTPRPRPRTADSSVKADPPPPPCLPCGWAMGAHTPASAPHCRQFSEGGPSPTSLPTLRVGHGCSHPGLGPALQTVQWRRTLPHLPAYLAGGPWVPWPRTADSSVKADPPPPPCLPCGWAMGAHTPPRPRTADSSVKADPPPPPCLPCGWAMGAHTTASAPHCRQFSEGGPSPTSLPTLRVGHGCSHPGLGPALQTVQWRRTLPHLPAYLAGGPWVLTPRPRPRTADSSVKADPPPPPCLPCGWAMGAHTPASAPHCRQFSEGGPSPTSLPTLRVGHGCSHPGLGPALQTVQWRRTLPHLPAYLAGGPHTPASAPQCCLPCGWAMGAHTPASAPHCRQFSEGGPSPTSLPTLRVGHGCSHPGLGPALQTVQWRRTLPHLPAYLAGGPWVLTPRPRPRTADSSVKADPPPPPCLLAGGPWVLTLQTVQWRRTLPHLPAYLAGGPWVLTPKPPHCRQFSEGGPSPTSLPTLRVGHGCSHPGLGPALQTVQWRRTLPHLPAYLAGGPWVLTPRPRPRTADSSVKADPPPPPCLPCGWAMGAHTPASAPHCRQFSEGGPSPTSLPTLRVGHGCSHPASAPHCRQFSEGGPSPTSLPTLRVGHGCSHPACTAQFSEGGPSPTSLPTLRVGHGCSHPGLGPALQTVQWRRTLPHLPAYLAGGPWVLTPRPRPRTADSSVKADPPPPPCLPCGWAMGAHTPASAPHSHPGLSPALQTVQWRRTLPHLPAYLAGGPWVLTPRPRPRTADSSVKADPPPPPCLPCGWAMGAHTPALAPHCRQFSEGGPSPTSLPTLRVGHGCSHPGLGPALQTVQWRRTLPHLPAYLAGGPWVLTPRPRPHTADSSVKADPPPPPCLPCGWAMGAHTPADSSVKADPPPPPCLPCGWAMGAPPRPRPRTADSSVKADPPPPPCLPCGWAMGAHTPASARTADSSVKADPPPPPCLPCEWAMGAHTPAWAPHCRQFSEGGPSPTSLPTLRVGHGCSHLARPRPRTADSSVKADPPPPPCLPCGWAMGAHTPASAPHCRQFSEGGPSPTSLPTLRVGHGCSHPGLGPALQTVSVKADPPPPPCLPCGWAMGAHTPASAPHCRQFSEGGPSPTSLPTLRVGHGCSHPGLGPALQTVQWRRTLPHLPAYLAGGPWVLTPRPRPRTADSSVKADPPPPPCPPCGWAMGAHTQASAPTADSSEGGPSPTSLPTLRVGHGCSHPSLRPTLQTVQWRRTLPHLPAYLAGGPWVLTPRPRPRTADSLVKAEPPPSPCLPCGWAMGAHTPASAPHCRQFSEGGPSPTSLPTLRVGHGCSHPGLGPALQTVQWRRTLPHLPAHLLGHGCCLRPALQTVQCAYLAGGPWVLTPKPPPHTAGSSVKADPPPPPCLPCGWAMGAHTPASAPHCRQFSEGGPSPTSLPTLRVGHGCSHPGLGPALQTVQWRRTLPHLPAYLAGGPWVLTLPPTLGPALQTVQWRRTLPHLPAYLAGGPWVLTPRPRPRTADSSVKADPPPPPCLPCGWAMGAHTPALAPHCRQFSEGGPSPTSLPTLRVGHGCSHPGLGPALQTSEGGPSPTSLPTLRVGHGCSHPGLGPALQTVQWRRTLPHLPAYLAGGPWVLTPRPRPRTADSSVKADPPPPPCLPCGWAMGAHSRPGPALPSEGVPSPTSLPTLRVGHGCSHPGLGPALQTVQWRRTLPHLPAYLAGGPWVLTPRPRPRTADSSVKADPPPPPCLPCGWAMGAHTQASAPHCRQFSEGGPSPTSLPTLRVGHGCSHPSLRPALQAVQWRRTLPHLPAYLAGGPWVLTPGLGPALQTVQWRRSLPHLPAYLAGGPWVLTSRPWPRTADSSVKADPPPPPCLPCGWAMGAHTRTLPLSLPTLLVGLLGPALQTVQWRRTLPHLPAYLAGGPWVLTPRPRPRTADSSVKADPPPPPCLPCGWAMGAHTPAWAPHCRQFSEGGPSPTSLPTLRVGHGCSHPGLGPAVQTVQWRRTLPHLPAYLAGGPWVLTPRPRPRTADSSVKADPPPPPCLPCGWAMGAHTPASAPHCRQFSEGGPSPTSLPTLRVGHGCSHPSLRPALQTVQWRRTLPHLPAYLAGGPWVLTPKPRPRTADSSVKADPPPPPCLPCGWAMGAHTPASAPHCRQFSEGGPSPTSLPTLRVGHGCSHPGLGPALQTVQWRRTLPHLPAYLAGGPWVLTPRPRPRTADSSVKADPPPPPCLPCGWAMGAHTPASAPHCRQFSEGGPSPTSLPTLRVGHGCSHPGLKWGIGPRTADSSVKADPPPPPCLPCGWAMGAHTPAPGQFSEGGPSPTSLLPCGWAMGAHTRPGPRTADSSVKADPPPPPCLPCGWAMGAHTPASAPHCRQFSEGGPSPTSLPTLRVGHGCSHPGLGPALQTVQWRRTLPHLPAYLAGGPWVLTPRPRPRTADSSVKADPPPPPCLPCGWAMGAHTPASAPHCRQFSEGGPSPTSLPTLRVGHGCSHPGLGPALQTVQWRRTLPHLPAYLAGGPWVLTPRPRPRTADSSVKADPPPPPCLPCGWAMGAHTPASAPHCRQFSEGGPSPTSLPTLRVGHGCSHPGLGPALQTVQWRRTLPHLPAYLAGGPWVLTPRPRPRTADSSVKADPPPPPCLPCGWAMGAHTTASARTADSSVKADPPPPPCLPCEWAMGAHTPTWAPHCRQFSEGGPSPSLNCLQCGAEAGVWAPMAHPHHWTVCSAGPRPGVSTHGPPAR